MPEAHEVYSARQAADRLGLSPAMTRRYGAMLEEVTGEPIKQHPRDGRQYQAQQIAVMLQAKAYVESNPRLTVSDALKIALGITSEPVAPEILTAPQIGSQQLTEAFSKALEQSLLPELRELRAELQALRQEMREIKEPQALHENVRRQTTDSGLLISDSKDAAGKQADPADNERFFGYQIRDKDHQPKLFDGPIVRFARRFERLLGIDRES